jgi:hypothetical protein
LVQALKVKYDEALKQGSLWYQDKVNSLTEKTNGLSGGEWYVCTYEWQGLFPIGWLFILGIFVIMTNVCNKIVAF